MVPGFIDNDDDVSNNNNMSQVECDPTIIQHEDRSVSHRGINNDKNLISNAMGDKLVIHFDILFL